MASGRDAETFKSAFMSAVESGDIAPEDINQGDDFGRNLLMHVCSRPDTGTNINKKGIAIFLLNKGIDPTLRDDERSSPLDIIKRHSPRWKEEFERILSLRNAALYLLNKHGISHLSLEGESLSNGEKMADEILTSSRGEEVRDELKKMIHSVVDETFYPVAKKEGESIESLEEIGS